MLIVSAAVDVLSYFSLFFFFYAKNDVQPLFLLVQFWVGAILSIALQSTEILLVDLLSVGLLNCLAIQCLLYMFQERGQ